MKNRCLDHDDVYHCITSDSTHRFSCFNSSKIFSMFGKSSKAGKRTGKKPYVTLHDI